MATSYDFQWSSFEKRVEQAIQKLNTMKKKKEAKEKLKQLSTVWSQGKLDEIKNNARELRKIITATDLQQDFTYIQKMKREPQRAGERGLVPDSGSGTQSPSSAGQQPVVTGSAIKPQTREQHPKGENGKLEKVLQDLRVQMETKFDIKRTPEKGAQSAKDDKQAIEKLVNQCSENLQSNEAAVKELRQCLQQIHDCVENDEYNTETTADKTSNLKKRQGGATKEKSPTENPDVLMKNKILVELGKLSKEYSRLKRLEGQVKVWREETQKKSSTKPVETDKKKAPIKNQMALSEDGETSLSMLKEEFDKCYENLQSNEAAVKELQQCLQQIHDCVENDEYNIETTAVKASNQPKRQGGATKEKSPTENLDVLMKNKILVELGKMSKEYSRLKGLEDQVKVWREETQKKSLTEPVQTDKKKAPTKNEISHSEDGETSLKVLKEEFDNLRTLKQKLESLLETLKPKPAQQQKPSASNAGKSKSKGSGKGKRQNQPTTENRPGKTVECIMKDLAEHIEKQHESLQHVTDRMEELQDGLRRVMEKFQRNKQIPAEPKKDEKQIEKENQEVTKEQLQDILNYMDELHTTEKQKRLQKTNATKQSEDQEKTLRKLAELMSVENEDKAETRYAELPTLLQRLLEENKANSERLKKDIANLRRENDEFKKNASEHAKEIEENDRLRDENNKFKPIVDKATDMQQKIHDQAGKIDELEAATKDLNARLTEKEQRNNDVLAWLNKQLASLQEEISNTEFVLKGETDKVIGAIANDMEPARAVLRDIRLQLNDYTTKYNRLHEEYKKHKSVVIRAKHLEQETHDQAEKIKELESTTKDLRKRLSKVASANLTDNNQNIADLSDPHRPTKIGEQFSELYDNQWTDAFEVCSKTMTEEKAIHWLYEVVTGAYVHCVAVSDKQSAVVRSAFFCPASCPTQDMEEDLTAIQRKALQDIRKETSSKAVRDVQRTYLETMKGKFTEETLVESCHKFIEQCVELCWYMAIQTPRVYMERADLVGKPLNKDEYRPYTKSGKIIAFVVWPVIYLSEDGGVLAKGVAQPK